MSEKFMSLETTEADNAETCKARN